MQSSSVTQSNQFDSIWQEHIPDIAWGTLLLAVCISLGYYLTINSALAGHLAYPVAALVCSYLTFASFTVMHDAGHGSVVKAGSRLKPLESVIGWVASIPLLVAPYRLFQKIHDRHHAFTNDPERDPDHYILTNSWLGIVLNSLYIPVQYHVLAFTKLRKIKVIRDAYLSTVVYLFCTIGASIVLTIAGFGLEVLCFFVIPSVVAVFFLAMFFDYVPHHPHKSRDRYHDSRIYPGKLMNALLLGQNYHLIHHMYPRLPWYTYQEVFRRILPELEANDAPIEDMTGGVRPGFMKSPATCSLLDGGRAINMVLEVAEINPITPDSVSVQFRLPVGEKLDYLAGQYITVSKWLDDELQTRCYSLCAGPDRGLLKIAVRRTVTGAVSGFISDGLKAGDELVVQGPFGDFVYPPAKPKDIRSLVLVAGGSGITPILSIIEQALADAGDISIDLIYANHSRESIMFFEELQQLKSQNLTRLSIRYVISQDTGQPLDIHGRLDATLLRELLPQLANQDKKNTLPETAFYICGPAGLKNTVVDCLKDSGVEDSRVQVEHFAPVVTQPVGQLHNVDITLADGTRHALSVASNQTVLEVAKSKGIQLPHACGAGTCGSCKLKLVEGVANSIPDNIPGITFEEKQAGFTLACQCKPVTAISMSEV